MRTALTIAVLASIIGCATTPTPTGDVKLVDALSGKFSTSSPSTGQILVKRDIGQTGFLCRHRVYVDATPAADLKPGQGVLLHLPAGPHILGLEAPAAICGGGSVESAVRVEAGTALTFRTGTDGNGGLHISPTAF